LKKYIYSMSLVSFPKLEKKNCLIIGGIIDIEI
jgi:hypothetical protein